MSYVELIEKSEELNQKARDYYNLKEFDLALFYYNAAHGFKAKARAMYIN